MRILNADALTSHGNVAGRKAVIEILEAGLRGADPYLSTLRLVRREGNRLIVGNPDFVPAGSPRTGDEVFDLDRVDRIFVFGAGKGVQFAARAFEEALGDRLTGGHVIAKHDDDHVLERIGVTYGAHPVPDEGCVLGCQRIIAMAREAKLTERDIVFTIGANGISSLLTLPAPGISLEDVRQVTYMMQIERGAPTFDLNRIRNHIDSAKGGMISRNFLPARIIHVVAHDMNTYDFFANGISFVHFLTDFSTFDDAVAMLKRWHAWDEVPESVRAHLLKADPAQETVKRAEFEAMGTRLFCVLPRTLGMLPSAEKKCIELGFTPHRLATWIHAEASQLGLFTADMARNVENEGLPFEPPCALLSGGEMLVTVGKETGMGGRNQEYALSAARRIAGDRNIVMGAIDSDGTDGPGGQFVSGGEQIPCLAGGIVDGETLAEAKAAGVDVYEALRRHDTSPALWGLKSGILATHNMSMTDLCVTLILGRGRVARG